MGEQTNQVQLKNFNRRTVLNYIRKMEPQPKRGWLRLPDLPLWQSKNTGGAGRASADPV